MTVNGVSADPGESERPFDAKAPVEFIETDEPGAAPEEGAGLCLSGGGYRAMVFHVGALKRLNEAGLLRSLRRISSVSGGSITAGVLGMNWANLDWNDQNVAKNFDALVTQPIRRMASTSIDVLSILSGFLTFTPVSWWIEAHYRRVLFRAITLQALPDDRRPPEDPEAGPRFVINATNLRSGVLWRFSRPYMADYTIGRVPEPEVQLATAVAASSAFPPMLSPVVIKLEPDAYAPDDGPPPRNAAHRRRIVLTDGGVYDNMGMETVWKRYRTVLVSDAGGRARWWSERAGKNWFRQFWRVFGIEQQQVGRLRRRQLIASYVASNGDASKRLGAYWGIGSHIDKYGLEDALPAPFSKTRHLRDVRTRLKRMPNVLQERLINWGYAICDAALRRHVEPAPAPPTGFPYPQAGVG